MLRCAATLGYRRRQSVSGMPWTAPALHGAVSVAGTFRSGMPGADGSEAGPLPH